MKKRMIILILILSLADPIKAEAKETDYQAIIENVADDYDICPELVEAICETESRYTPDAQRGSCIGLMQVNKNIHKARMNELGVTDLTDPEQNIRVGCDLLADLFETYEDPAMVLDAYHGNLHSMSYYESGNITSYASTILDRSEELERNHGK